MEVETNGWMMKPIGVMRTPYASPAEIPRGLGAIHGAEGTLEVFPEYTEGLLDIEGFSHLYLLWVFHRPDAVKTGLLRTPPSDDRPHGVFATRSPYRPNPIGLTVVELQNRTGSILYLKGVDMIDQTPVLDIKPYLSSIPPEILKRGWLAEAEARQK